MLGFSSKHHPALREMLLMHQGMPLEAHCQDNRGINKKTLETKPALEQRVVVLYSWSGCLTS